MQVLDKMEYTIRKLENSIRDTESAKLRKLYCVLYWIPLSVIIPICLVIVVLGGIFVAIMDAFLNEVHFIRHFKNVFLYKMAQLWNGKNAN